MHGNPWTEAEILLLKEIYPVKSRVEVTSLTPKHSWMSIQRKTSYLGIYRSSEIKSQELVKSQTARWAKGYSPSLCYCGENIPRRRKFCSAKCYWGYLKLTALRDEKSPYSKREERQCIYCGNFFWVRSGKKQLHDRKYCKRSCWLSHSHTLSKRRPTKPEIYFQDLCIKYNLPFRYTGDGTFIIEGHNPDFVEINGRKIVVEIFGDWWHSKLLNSQVPYTQTLEGKQAIYHKYGWKCIVLWVSELRKKLGHKYALDILAKEGIECREAGK